MAVTSQKTFSNAFPWMKMFQLLSRFHWSLFTRQLSQGCNWQYSSIGSEMVSLLGHRAGVKYVLSNTNTNTNTFFSGVSNTNTNTNTPAKIWSNTNTNTNTAHQIQIQIHNEAETKLPPFYRWHIQIHCIVRRLFYLFKFYWKLFPKVQSTISLHWFR